MNWGKCWSSSTRRDRRRVDLDRGQKYSVSAFCTVPFLTSRSKLQRKLGGLGAFLLELLELGSYPKTRLAAIVRSKGSLSLCGISERTQFGWACLVLSDANKLFPTGHMARSIRERGAIPEPP